ncbi:coiled-coil-helix-coiled-coil-helix domain-containing protein 10, mitochondrial [Tanacetum coccineum]|uniref:Coiled-coil-helix-coiled-coil-helix domain-containing protein 10, mitochondrial n=1 Tax=Tanacetum coccineum TaxID=301880 RepID=A0ABQ5BLZ1_9ASTR
MRTIQKVNGNVSVNLVSLVSECATTPEAPTMNEPRTQRLGVFVEGMLWATGFCIAHNTMKAITGPRVVKVDKVPTASPAAQATSARVGNTPDACVWQHKAFQDCINTYGGDINYCQFYMDMLSICRKSGSATSAFVGF